MKRNLFWLEWALVNTLPFLIITLLISAIGQVVQGQAMSLLSYGVLAATLALMQSLVLRKYIHQPSRWIFATLAGFLIAMIVSMPVMAISDVAGCESLAIVVGNGISGAVLGATQWLILRREVQNSSLWVLASSAAWFLMAGIGAALYKIGWAPASEEIQFPGYRELALIVWLLIGYGAITGGVLQRLLQHRVSERQSAV